MAVTPPDYGEPNPHPDNPVDFPLPTAEDSCDMASIDSTYWGLYPDDGVVTAWIALSDATVESGAMKFLPGSHHKEQIPHKDTYDKYNLLSRGQIAVTDVDENRTVNIVLKAGEVSLHHIRMLHSSGPNDASHRRVGLAVRYIPRTCASVDRSCRL